jgi:hypothetical protein
MNLAINPSIAACDYMMYLGAMTDEDLVVAEFLQIFA